VSERVSATAAGAILVPLKQRTQPAVRCPWPPL